jgi:hypothetical protein
VEASKADLLSLLKAVDVLAPYLDEIVIVGGWVPFLCNRYGEMPSPHPLLRTMDIDIVVPRHVEERGRPTIDEMLSRAGYTVSIYGSDVSVVKYELTSPVTEIEFLTPAIGKSGKAVLAVQRGLQAQALKYLEILLENNRRIKIIDNVDGTDICLVVTVPSPGAFIYQKGLTLSPGSRRPATKIDKDLYYIFGFLDSPKQLRDSIPVEINSLRSRYHARWFSKFIRNLNHYFPESGAEGPARLANLYTGPMPTGTFQNYAHRTFRDFIQALQEIAAQ